MAEQPTSSPEPQAATQAAPSAAGATVIDELLTMIRPPDEARDSYRAGLGEFFRRVGDMAALPKKVDRKVVDSMIADIDAKLSAQINEILHQPEFQKLESAWRGLWFTVSRTNFLEENRIEILNASKEDILADFEDSPDWEKSGMYKQIYRGDYNTLGGKPIGAMIANYEFGYGPQDIKFLQEISKICAISKVPFIAAASARMFNLDSHTQVPEMRDLYALFEGQEYTKWNSFRDTDDARYIGLTMPRFLLRLPYGADTNPCKEFDFEEDVRVENHERYLWGNAAFSFATRLTESFADYRWYNHIVGPKGGGTVENLPLHQYKAMGQIQTKIPVEVSLDDAREKELEDFGFIPLIMRKETDNACFMWAQSVKRPKNFPNTPVGRASAENDKLGLTMPYLFVACRLAHYLKVIQRENIGSLTSKDKLETELNRWIKQYVNNTEFPSKEGTGRTPLKEAKITVEKIEGKIGAYQATCKFVPHMRLSELYVDISLVSALEQPTE